MCPDCRPLLLKRAVQVQIGLQTLQTFGQACYDEQSHTEQLGHYLINLTFWR